MTDPEILLQVERRDDGQYYVFYNGREFILASPISVDFEGRPEWEHWLNNFRFSAIRVEEGL